MFKGRRQLAHRPVAAKKHPIKAKTIERMADIGLQRGRAAMRWFRLRDEAGNFARDIRLRGQFAELRPPPIDLLVADGRFRAVV